MLRMVPYRKNGFEKTFDDMFHMMDDFFNTENRVMKFKLDVSETEEAYLVEAELPGVEKDQITIDFEQDILLIKVVQKEETQEEKKNYIRKERHESTMERALRFTDANFENTQAKLENGILKIVMPKLRTIETKRRIEIE